MNPMWEGKEDGMEETQEVTQAEGRKPERDYTRAAYQNLMTVVEFLEGKSPLPVTQKAIAEETGLSKNSVFDICWNLVRRGWAEDVGGSVRLKRGTNEKDAFIGRMVVKLVEDSYRVHLDKKS